MKLGYIARHNLELNPQLTKQFEFKECSFTRRISSKSDRAYCKILYPIDYCDLVFNAELMKGNQGLILVNEPFLLDDELREKAIRWVEWANRANPEEYDLFYKITQEVRNDR